MIDSARDTFVRLGLAVLATVVALELMAMPARELEAELVARLVNALFGSSVLVLGQGQMLVAPVGQIPMVAEITTSCSSIAGVATLGALSIFILRGDLGDRVVAFTLGSVVWVILNLIRMGTAIVVSEYWGQTAFDFFHNWIGTGMALVGTVAAFMVMIRSSLPSDDEIRTGRA